MLDVLWRGLSPHRRRPITAPRSSRTLTYLCQGGIYDHVGGGFARYSVDADWLVPHFEKMLYDNGQLLSLLSYAYAETKQPLFRTRIDETVGWLVREMQLPGGGFASSLDADTEHEEGLTYVWSWDELQEALGDDFADLRARSTASRPSGNWEGRTSSIASRRLPASGWARTEEAELAALRELFSLAGATSGRSRPRRQGSWPTGTGSRSPAWHMPRA